MRRAGRSARPPILVGSLASRALETVQAITEELPKPRRDFLPHGEPVRSVRAVHEASLASGCAGLATLYAYLAKAGLADRASETGQSFLDQAVEAVCAVSMPPSLYGGFTGVAWAVAHLGDRENGANEDPSEEIDAALREYLTRAPWRDDYDLVSGLVGLGVYALERLPRAGAYALLSLIVDRIDEISEQTDTGITWLTLPDLLPEHQRKECPRGYYNLGLAHGVPGVIALLAGVCAAGIGGAKASRLLEGATGWLLSQKLSEGDGSAFPSWVVPGQPARPARSAWCYGDPGVAAALLRAARAVGGASWEREALSIARAAAERPPEAAGVRDAGLCHGAAGLGHVFNRMHRATGDECLGRAARYWFERTLDMRERGRGIGGYATIHPSPDGRMDWRPEAGLLTGAAGIALALLAAVTPVEPAWDRMLLLSIAEPKRNQRDSQGGWAW